MLLRYFFVVEDFFVLQKANSNGGIKVIWRFFLVRLIMYLNFFKNEDLGL